MAFHLDYTTYGLPNVGLSLTQSDQFRPVQNNNLGRGLYKQYNPTGPVIINAQWDWPATTYRQFRLAWENVNELRYGAAWFEADLPLGLDGDFLSNSAGVIGSDVIQQIQLTVGSDGTNHGFNNNPSYGETSPRKIGASADYGISDMRSSNANIFYLRNYTGVPIAGNGTIGLMFPGFSGSRQYEATYNNDDNYISTVTGIRDYLFGEINNTIQVGVVFQVPLVRKYACHFKSPFTATPIGYGSWWRMSAQLDVDMSPTLEGLLD